MNAPASLLILDELLVALKAAGVRFVHWKSNSHLAQALLGETDLDFFVSRTDRRQFRKIVNSIGALELSSRSWGSYPNVEDWLVFDKSTGRISHLHTHYALLTGLKRVKHLQLPWDEQIFRHARLDPEFGWPIPSVEMEFLMLLVRIWAKMPPWRMLFRPYIPAHIWNELLWLRNQLDLKHFSLMLGELFPKPNGVEWSNTVLGEPDQGEVLRIARHLYKQLTPNFRLSWSRACFRAVKLNVLFHLIRSLKKYGWPVKFGKSLVYGGTMVAFVGSDGAGKSTLVKAMAKWLAPKMDVHVIYLGAGDGKTGWINSSRRAISKLVGRKKLK